MGAKCCTVSQCNWEQNRATAAPVKRFHFSSFSLGDLRLFHICSLIVCQPPVSFIKRGGGKKRTRHCSFNHCGHRRSDVRACLCVFVALTPAEPRRKNPLNLSTMTSKDALQMPADCFKLVVCDAAPRCLMWLMMRLLEVCTSNQSRVHIIHPY